MPDSREKELAEAQRLGHIGSWTYSVESKKALWSAETFRIYGLEPAVEAPTAEVRADMIHPEDRAASAASVQAAIETGRPYKIELRIVRPDGSVRTIISRGEAHRDASGRVVELMGTVQDVTESKRIEDHLRVRERELSLVFENSRDAIFIADAESGRIVKANAAAARLLDRPVEEIIGMHQAELHPAESREEAIDIFRRHLNDRGGVPVESVVETRSGGRVPVEISAGLFDMADGRRVVHGTFRDICERKRVEAELRASEERYGLLLQNANDAVLVHEISPDAPGQFLEFNDQACRMLGYTREEMAGMSVADLDVPEQLSRIPTIIHDLYETGGAIFATEWLGKGRCRIPVEVSTRLFTLQGRPVVLSISRDISERVKADELLRLNMNNIRRALGGTINVIMAMVERRDPYTAGHQRRVADLARTIGTALGLDADRIEGLRVAGSIHDIGKIAVPLEILSKSTGLSVLEMQLIREHAKAGHDILKDLEFPWPIARLVLEHHERLDGSGYPQKLKGEATLLESRILVVADVVEAMASHRPYRPAHGLGPALAEIEQGRGLLYDVAVVDTCLRLFREKSYRLVE